MLRDEILEARRGFYKKMDLEILGREVETVYRKDKVKLNPRLERIQKEELKWRKTSMQFMQWGRGRANNM